MMVGSHDNDEFGVTQRGNMEIRVRGNRTRIFVAGMRRNADNGSGIPRQFRREPSRSGRVEIAFSYQILQAFPFGRIE